MGACLIEKGQIIKHTRGHVRQSQERKPSMCSLRMVLCRSECCSIAGVFVFCIFMRDHSSFSLDIYARISNDFDVNISLFFKMIGSMVCHHIHSLLNELINFQSSLIFEAKRNIYPQNLYPCDATPGANRIPPTYPQHSIA